MLLKSWRNDFGATCGRHEATSSGRGSTVWSYRTVLEQRIRERRQTLEEFAEYAEAFAREHGEVGTLGVRHLQRLVAGRGARGKPLGRVRPATARLLERIFGDSIETLLGEPETRSVASEVPTAAPRSDDRSTPQPTSAEPSTGAGIESPTADGVEASGDLLSAFDWLDQHTGWAPGTAKRKVRSRLSRLSAGDLLDRNARRSRIGRDAVAEALSEYYGRSLANGYSIHRARVDDCEVGTSLLTRPDWIDLASPLTPEGDALALTEQHSSPATNPIDPRRAVHRLAEATALGVRMINAPLYRLHDVDFTGDTVNGSLNLAPFVEYALTSDLLEGELLDAISQGQSIRPGELPLRDAYLPDLPGVLDLSARKCVGGVLALCAVARPADPYRGPADFALLVQERSGNVLNATGRLAVIPKGFHQPLKEARAEARIGSTLLRELEEELFGRAEVDGTSGEPRVAAPMHRSRLSDPMRWLLDEPGRLRRECTGFGFNLVSGNYEFASLVVIDDEEFWRRYGGDIEANWEASGLRLYSTLDRELLNQLIADEAWSNEGLFALLQGIRRLGESNDPRLDLPTVDAEFTTSASGR
ncbi:transcriptional regulator [Saccharopolyspora sp. NPDC002578]